jgi:para-nitrobenzyl esterase
MLWFYGGSWEFGSGSFPLYDGVFDIALAEDVIIATINYRCAHFTYSSSPSCPKIRDCSAPSSCSLGVFGYLAGQPLIDDSADGSVGNYGFQDQRAAMQFLVDTATAFSGNPQVCWKGRRHQRPGSLQSSFWCWGVR